MLLKLILFAVNHFVFAGTLGFFGIGMGPSSQEKNQYGDISNIGNFGTSEGEADITSADKFWQSILSNDPAQMSKVLGPLMSTVNKQGQESKKTASEFGNRSGGTNAGMQMTDDKTRTTIDSAISSLTGGAASALGASGSSLLSTGLSAHQAAFSDANTIQQQRSAQINDLFKSIASMAGPLVSLIPGPAGKILGQAVTNLGGGSGTGTGSYSDGSSGGDGGSSIDQGLNFGSNED